ncbi:MAG TPA: serine hydrolase [Rubricoccaceae bacterium]
MVEFIAALDRRIPEWLEELSVPGAAVAVIEGGEVVHLRGYGLADVARAAPVTPQTGFNVGSISKAVTAWGVLRLVEQGRLDLDAPVERYLTRWHLPPSEFDVSGVTVRRLLSHTAGLSLGGYRGWADPDSVPTLEQSLSGRTNGAGDVRLVAAPGSRWDYSGGGYTLLQLLVEEVTGRPFADYMRDEVLVPFGMTRSTFALTPDILAAAARPYDELAEEMAPPRFAELAAAGLYTTPEDLARFALALLPGGGGGVLRPATVDTMLAVVPGTEGNWALGHSVVEFPDGQRRVGHGGGNPGWQANVWAGRDARDGLVVVTNASDGWNVVNQVVAEWINWKSGTARPIRKSVATALIGALHEGGAAAATARYAALKADRRDEYVFDEGELNRLGYALLHKGRVADAITLFELNAQEYPEAWNPYDSLGDAYMEAGDTEAAIRSYQRSLELNPENENAKRNLRILAER